MNLPPSPDDLAKKSLRELLEELYWAGVDGNEWDNKSTKDALINEIQRRWVAHVKS